ncbi:MAG: hypothetical protein J6U54_16090 [Clostridiales bacterium]|nr:hypothetical protein [Clostridiales bacterium]
MNGFIILFSCDMHRAFITAIIITNTTMRTLISFIALIALIDYINRS